MASVGVCDEGSQIVYCGGVCSRRIGETGGALLSVVEKLGGEEVVNLVWDGVRGIISKVGSGLIGG
jgi:hypothetical protein